MLRGTTGSGVRVQENVPIAEGLGFTIDLVIYRQDGLEAVCVLDTKYKASSMPSAQDVQQVLAYAEAKGCRDAVLVYPSVRTQPFEAQVGEVRVRTLAFDLGEDLESSGLRFLEELLNGLPSGRAADLREQGLSSGAPPFHARAAAVGFRSPSAD